MALPSLESLGLLHLGTREPSSLPLPSRSPSLPASSAPGVAFSSESFASKPVDPARDPRDTSTLNAFAFDPHTSFSRSSPTANSPRVDTLNPRDWAERHPYLHLQQVAPSEAAHLSKPHQPTPSLPPLSSSSSASSSSLSHPSLPPLATQSSSAWNVTEQGRWAEPLPINPMDALSAAARDAGRRFEIETQSYSARTDSANIPSPPYTRDSVSPPPLSAGSPALAGGLQTPPSTPEKPPPELQPLSMHHFASSYSMHHSRSHSHHMHPYASTSSTTSATDAFPRIRAPIIHHTQLPTERPTWRFACAWPGCGRRFPTPAHVERHARTHTGAKPFSCDVCGLRFSRKDNALVHQRKKHPSPA